MASGSFTAGAWVANGRVLHHRTRDHFGTEDDTDVVLSTAIGAYPAGTTVHVVLADLSARIAALGSSGSTGYTRTYNVNADALIAYCVRANAVLKKAPSSSFTADAVVVLGASMNADAVLKTTLTRSVTANAVFV